MEILEGLDELHQPYPYPVLTIGNFDGVHLAHQKLFAQAIELARPKGGTAMAMTFWPHPEKFFAPHREIRSLALHGAKKMLMGACGLDVTLIVPFTREFSETSALDFIQKIVLGRVGAQEVVVGYNFNFGKGRAGNARLLKEVASREGVPVHVMEPLEVGGRVVSSSSIRRLLAEGDVETASRMLGRNYAVLGEVMKGARRGADLGFATANLNPAEAELPRRGVYVARMKVRGKIHEGVVNVGVNPTFGGSDLSVEAHLFDFHQDLYGETLEVQFCQKLRDEKTFPSPEALVKQIQKDVATAKAYFQGSQSS